MSQSVSGHIYPARFCSVDLDGLRTFVLKVSDLAMEMGIRFEAIDPQDDEDRTALMRLIGADTYSGTLKANDLDFNIKVKKAKTRSVRR